MIITIVSFKGGVGQTTTAIHLAAQLQQQANTVLIDADPNQSALSWAKRGTLPFDVVDQWQQLTLEESYEHSVVDAPARPIADELRVLAESCDLLILPTTLHVMAVDALVVLLEQLKSLQITHYRILLTQVPTKANREMEQLKTMVIEANLPLFNQSIRELVAFQKAAQAGVLVKDVRDPRADDAWQDYQQVGQELFALFGL